MIIFYKHVLLLGEKNASEGLGGRILTKDISDKAMSLVDMNLLWNEQK
jgi:hypothetical protein